MRLQLECELISVDILCNVYKAEGVVGRGV
jgi:hypothetical protein